jgi:hypothetical protein
VSFFDCHEGTADPDGSEGGSGMDPNACLNRFVDACVAKDWEEAKEAHSDLCTWLRGGGFEPKWTPITRDEFMRWRRK